MKPELTFVKVVIDAVNEGVQWLPLLITQGQKVTTLHPHTQGTRTG